MQDTITLREWDGERGGYTGSYLHAKISYIMRDPTYCKEGYCVLALQIDRTWGEPVGGCYQNRMGA